MMQLLGSRSILKEHIQLYSIFIIGLVQDNLGVLGN